MLFILSWSPILFYCWYLLIIHHQLIKILIWKITFLVWLFKLYKCISKCWHSRVFYWNPYGLVLVCVLGNTEKHSPSCEGVMKKQLVPYYPPGAANIIGFNLYKYMGSVLWLKSWYMVKYSQSPGELPRALGCKSVTKVFVEQPRLHRVC